MYCRRAYGWVFLLLLLNFGNPESFSQLQVSVCVAAPDTTTRNPAAVFNQTHSEEDWGSKLLN